MAAKKTTFVKHPTITDLVTEIPAGKLGEWKDAGWLSATKADVEAAEQVDDQTGA